MSGLSNRKGTLLFVAALVISLPACLNIGGSLGTRHADLPLGEGGTASVKPEGIAVHSGGVRIDSVPLPERAWAAQKLKLDNVELRGSTNGSGVVEVSLLVGGYPAALWSVAVEGGRVESISPETMPVPGQPREKGRKGVRPMPFPQLPKMRAAFTELAADRRPQIADDLEFSLVGDEKIPNAEWQKVYRGIHDAFQSRGFDVTIITATDHDVGGTLAIETLVLTLFDSGQRVMGGMETADS